MYCCSMLLCNPPTHGIIPKFRWPIKRQHKQRQHKHDQLSKSSTTPLLHCNCSRRTYQVRFYFVLSVRIFVVETLYVCVSLVSWNYCTSNLICLCLHGLRKEVHPVAWLCCICSQFCRWTGVLVIFSTRAIFCLQLTNEYKNTSYWK